MHGDAHPHNALWVDQRTAGARLCLIDFEMVGVGSNAQDLGQYVISHPTPALRRAHERQWVEGYHAELLATLRARGLEAEAAGYSLDSCFAEYVAGGFGRWAWFLPLFMGMPPMAQVRATRGMLSYMQHERGMQHTHALTAVFTAGHGTWYYYMAPLAQFFHDQIAAFAHDHIPDAADAPMPRV